MWHSLKLHPYGPDAEGIKARREAIISQNYEEVVFNEPVEQFYNLLTGGTLTAQPAPKAKSGKGAKAQQQQQQQAGRTAEIPYSDSPKNPYSQKSEAKELDKLGEATKTVDRMVKEERAKLTEREAYLAKLKETESLPVVQKKK